MYRLLLATSGLVLFSLGAVRSGSAQGRLESVPLPAQPLVLHALASPAPGVVLGVEGAHLALAGPNPMQGRAAISVAGRALVRIALYDALGRCVQQRDVMPGRVEISVAGLAPGFYALRAEGAPATLLLTVVR